MVRIVVMNSVSLDGVMQGPGRRGEDDRAGFSYSGWAAPRGGDEVIREAMAERMAPTRGWLLGRRTYDDVLRYWNSVPDSPFAARLNAATKYVATTRPDEPLRWPNSVALTSSSVDWPEVPDAVGDLRARGDGVLGIMGSSVLVHALQQRGLIDEYLLMIHPLVLGTGIRLFRYGGPNQALRLVEPARTATTGVIVAVFQRAD
jgi:dihydrofolate reductase